MSNYEMITISTEEYLELQDRDYRLQCLENAGVDNWEWYDFAMQEYNSVEEVIEDNHE